MDLKTSYLNKKIGVIIFCRYSSSRLPGKILKKINGKTILNYIVESMREVIAKENIVVATSVQKSDDIIATHCEELDFTCFRGSLDNVAERFLKCMETYQFDYAVRICGDNLFADVNVIRQMIALVEGEPTYDFISNVKGRTFPKGMSVEIVKTSFYQKIYKQFQSPDHYEHVTLYLYENEKLGERKYIYNTICPDAKGIHLAIDTREDFERAKKIIAKQSDAHYRYGVKEIYQLLKDA